MLCPPERRDNPQVLASGLSPLQVNKLWYNYFIQTLSVYTLNSVKYFVLKFAIFGKGGIFFSSLELPKYLNQPHDIKLWDGVFRSKIIPKLELSENLTVPPL